MFLKHAKRQSPFVNYIWENEYHDHLWYTRINELVNQNPTPRSKSVIGLHWLNGSSTTYIKKHPVQTKEVLGALSC